MYEAVGLSVRLGGRTIVDRADLRISPGKVTALVGPNGAGKSTLLKAMAGGLRSSSGEVRINGILLSAMRPAELADLRAVLIQSATVSAPFSVDQVVRLGMGSHARDGRTAALVGKALAAVALGGFEDRTVTRLSGGEQQRVHAARVLAQLWSRPADGTTRYLLLDEPTAHLDPAHQFLLRRLARDHAAAGGGVLAILHDLNLAMSMGDDVAVMQGGRIVASGPTSDVLTAELASDLYGIAFEAIEHGGTRWLTPAHWAAG